MPLIMVVLYIRCDVSDGRSGEGDEGPAEDDLRCAAPVAISLAVI